MPVWAPMHFMSWSEHVDAGVVSRLNAVKRYTMSLSQVNGINDSLH